MTYKVSVLVTKEFESQDKAEAFANDVLEKTKGANFSKSIEYVSPTFAGSMKKADVSQYTFNTEIHKPIAEDSAVSVQKRATKVARLGLISGA